jgi:hypothetical protein
MPDFERKTIEVRYYSDDYGPHNFDMEEALPGGTILASVNVKSYLGKVDKESTLADETETTSELINDSKSIAVSDFVISVFFEYPTTAGWKSGQKHTLVFEITLDNDAKHNYYFQYVRVF